MSESQSNTNGEHHDGLHDRLPPQNLDAERGVLGSCLLLADVIDEVSLILRPDHFYSFANRHTFEAIKALWDRGVSGIDAVTVGEELDRRGKFAEVGGLNHLRELLETVPHAGHAGYYARIVHEKYRRRQLIYASVKSLQDAYNESQPIDDLIAEAQGSLAEAMADDVHGAGESIGDVLMGAWDQIGKRELGLPTGLRTLDAITGGLAPQNLIILAARPSMGKSAVASCVAHNVAAYGKSVLFVSLEMSKLELAERMLSSASGINGRRLKSGLLEEAERGSLMDASSAMATLQIYIDDYPGRTMAKIRALAGQVRRKHGLDLVLVDYLQLIEPEDRRVNREQQVAVLSRGLKCMAKELNIPVICLAQLNRDAEKGMGYKDRRPRIGSLRESGAIEQDADQVWLLWRPAAYELQQSNGMLYEDSQAELIVAKNRGGDTGAVWLEFDKFTTTFRDGSAPAPVDEFVSNGSF